MGAFDQATAAALAAGPAQLAWLEPFRARARAAWLGAALPDRKTEAWQHTSLAALTGGDYLRFGADDHAPLDAGCAAIAGLPGQRLVFVNGSLRRELCSAAAVAGVTRFNEADAAQRAVIEAHLGLAAGGGNPFVALNGSWLEDGLLLHVADAAAACEPLHIVHLTTAGARPFSVRQRLLVVLEDNCQATVVEHFASTGDAQNCFVSGVTELALKAGARLTHYRLHLEEEHAIHIGGVYARLQRNAALDSFALGLGGQLKRLDLVIHHEGEGSECRLNGVYLAKGRQHIDLHATIEHEAPGGTTSETFRGIVNDAARAVFNGRIHIHPGAQKTIAELSNRNLLLTNTAEVYTKPELEIYADDVRCAHGATVSQIDDQTLYYMRSRGIDRKEAEIMLSFGFINELLAQLRHEPLRQLLQPLLGRWFGADSRLTRHLP